MELRAHRILWGAFTLSVVMMAVVSKLLPPSPTAEETLGPVLAPALTLVALSLIGLSFLLPRFLPEPRAAMVLSFALCDSAAVLGLMLHFAAGWSNAWMLFGAALIGLALHFPRERSRPPG